MSKVLTTYYLYFRNTVPKFPYWATYDSSESMEGIQEKYTMAKKALKEGTKFKITKQTWEDIDPETLKEV